MSERLPTRDGTTFGLSCLSNPLTIPTLLPMTNLSLRRHLSPRTGSRVSFLPTRLLLMSPRPLTHLRPVRVRPPRPHAGPPSAAQILGRDRSSRSSQPTSITHLLPLLPRREVLEHLQSSHRPLSSPLSISPKRSPFFPRSSRRLATRA